jgi:phosphohistidine phosphatase SixA
MLRLTLLLIAIVISLPAQASDALLARLAEPRTHALMRHAVAPGTGDPENLTLGVCETQRNLSDDGRRQARRAGDMLREAGVSVDVVWSSQWCRCLETAREMALGPVVDRAMLNSFSRAPYKRPARTRQVREALAALPPGDTALLVTHNKNVTALTGEVPLSGEIQVIKVSESGEIELLGSVRVPVR